MNVGRLVHILGVCRWLCPGLMAAVLLSGCATPAPLSGHVRAGAGESWECAQFFVALDDAVAAARVRDAGAVSIPGFPYLRVDRFLASFREDPLSPAAFAAWVDRLQALDLAGRRAEIANLPVGTRMSLERVVPGRSSLLTAVSDCGRKLRRADIASPATREMLRARAMVPDEYRTAWRVFGVYPLTSLFVARRIQKWQRNARETFTSPLDRLPRSGKLIRYVPHSSPPPLTIAGAAALVENSAGNPLGVPEPMGSNRARLFAMFAPVWEVDVVERADRIGRPGWYEQGTPDVDTARPVTFRRLSYVRFGGKSLLQLNYIVWFPARPRMGGLDLYGGNIDGVTWRVTLDTDGRPLLYDSIHNCGCYHMLFPSARLHLKPEASDLPEPPLVPQSAPRLQRGERITVRLAHGTHYVERVYAADTPADGIVYQLKDYSVLRSLPASRDGRRSLFGPDGIVPGTDRRERWLLWPMGVPAPGAMRQWGHHAVAFVGRRHFDDPDLISRLFERVRVLRTESEQ